MSHGDAVDPIDPAPEARRPRRLKAAVLGMGLLVVGGAAAFTYQQVEPVVESRKYASITYVVPTAPQLTAQEGETVYRIDPTASSLTYEVAERFAGKQTSTATGVTNGIAGDLAVNAQDLGASRVGEIVANIEQFHSDNNLRDARLRHEFLDSHRYPLATFEIDEIEGLEGELREGEEHAFTMTGTATVKEQTVPVAFEATAVLEDGALRATASTTAKLSDLDAGPINIAGLVSTEDEVALTFELTAYDPTERTIPTTITGPDAADPPADAPSFARTVQPILEANCASCHATGAMGAAHVTIDDAGDAQAISDGLRTVTELGYMPPWPASDEGVELEHVMSLTDDEIAAIAAWSEAGGPLDVAPETPIEATDDPAGPKPRQDLVLERPAYTGSVDTPDDYRCFVLDPELDEAQFMTGYEFVADDYEQLHHVQVFHISEAQKEAAAGKDGADGRPGWSCYSGPGLRGGSPNGVPGRTGDPDVGFSGQNNLVAGWVPGQAPSVFPEGTGVELEPGEALVLQVHYNFDHHRRPEPDRSTLALQLDPIDDETLGLRTINPIGPVEIPCAPEDADEPLCDRDAALADNVRLYGPSGAANESGLLMLCNTTPEELTASFDGQVAESSCDQVVPEDGRIVAVLGHMHTIGRSLRITLDADTPDEQILLDIPEWSFDWQMNYELSEPLRVEAGQPLRLDCSWDRSIDPLRPPKYMVFAEGTNDEMCFATYALIPDDQ